MTKVFSTKECVNDCGNKHTWNEKDFLKLTELKDKEELCICSECRGKHNFTADPYSRVFGWVDKAIRGVDGFSLKTR